uniref:(northern house mosquito) hypothetical protein n=1 Tax=Culex pipiens TaxID=7175 RepID=A0A8D8BNH1_CULPI
MRPSGPSSVTFAFRNSKQSTYNRITSKRFTKTSGAISARCAPIRFASSRANAPWRITCVTIPGSVPFSARFATFPSRPEASIGTTCTGSTGRCAKRKNGAITAGRSLTGFWTLRGTRRATARRSLAVPWRNGSRWV